jgi:hypothetical protein
MLSTDFSCIYNIQKRNIYCQQKIPGYKILLSLQWNYHVFTTYIIEHMLTTKSSPGYKLLLSLQWNFHVFTTYIIEHMYLLFFAMMNICIYNINYISYNNEVWKRRFWTWAKFSAKT